MDLVRKIHNICHFSPPPSPMTACSKGREGSKWGIMGVGPHCHPPALNQSDQWMFRVLSKVVTAFKTRVITREKIVHLREIQLNCLNNKTMGVI